MKLSLSALSKLTSAATIATVVAGAGLMTWSMSRLEQKEAALREAFSLSVEVEALLPLGLQLGQATRNVLLNAADQKASDNHRQASEELDGLLLRLDGHLRAADLSALRSPLNRVRDQFQADRGLQQQVMTLAKEGREAEGRLLLSESETPQWREVKKSIMVLRDLTVRRRVAVGESVAATSEQVRWLLWGLAVLLVLVPTWSAWSNRRGVAGAQRGIVDVRAVARQLAEATRGVSSSSQVLAAATARQAATNEETRATLVTLTNQVRSNATDADQARELSQESRTEAEAGVGAARDLTVALSQLQESSRDVQKVLKLIDDIAFQTNLLALNAAVEAARAGDAGAGFAVVAGEVRSLAHRSAEAARGSQDTIDETLRRMARGVELADQVQQRLQVISARTRSLDEVSARVATASKAQQAAVEQLEASVEAVEQVVMQTSAEAEAGASAAEELTSQAGFLERTMTALSESVGASASTHQPSSVPRSHAVERHGLMAPASS